MVLIESPIPEASHLSRAECAVCRRSMPITRCGLVRVHGPVASRCPGSRNPPFSTSTPEAARALSLPRLLAIGPLGTTDLIVIPWKPWQHEFLLSWKMEILKGQFDSPLPRTALPNRTAKLSLLFRRSTPNRTLNQSSHWQPLRNKWYLSRCLRTRWPKLSFLSRVVLRVARMVCAPST